MASSDYKTDGESLIRHLVARARTRLIKARERGDKYEEPVISIPLLKANEIGERAKARKEKVETLTQLLGEISFLMEEQDHPVNSKKLKTLVDRSIVIATQIK